MCKLINKATDQNIIEDYNFSRNNVLDESTETTVINEVASFEEVNGKIDIPKVRYILSYSCNMQCEYCFFPLQEKRMCTREELADSFEKWSAKINPHVVTLYGGEPLLNPDIIGVVSDAHHYWQHSMLEIITNGTLLLNVPDEVLRAFSEKNVYVTISRHFRTQNYLDQISQSLCRLRQFGIQHGIYKADLLWRALYAIDSEGVPIPYAENKPQEAYASCDGVNTTSIRGNYLYKCANVATCAELVKNDLLSGEWKEFSAHKPMSYENSISEIRKYLKQGVISACSLCAVKIPEIHEPRQLTNNEVKKMKQAVQRRLGSQ